MAGMMETRRAILLDAMHPVSMSGVVCSFNSDNTLKIPKVTANIIPTQDLRGYSTPWPGGTTKNLLDETTFTDGYYIAEDGAITTSSNSHYSAIVPVTAGETYTFSGLQTTSSTNNKRIHAYADGVWQEQIDVFSISASTQFSHTFTVPAGVNGIRVSDFKSDKNLQIEVGSTATSYIPYSNICPIVGYTGTTIAQRNKNLIDQATAPEFPRWIDTSNQWVYSSGGGKSLAFKCLPNTTYTLSLQGTTTVFRAGYITGSLPTNNSQSYNAYDVTRNGVGPGSIKVTTGSDATYIVIQIGAVVLRTSDLQIEYGSVATPYVPYRGQNYSIDWTSEAGTVYWGIYDPINGKLFDRSVYRTFSGGSDEAWEASTDSSSNSKYFRIPVGDYGCIVPWGDGGTMLCDQYSYTILSASTTGVGYNVYGSTTFNKSFVGIRPENVKDMTLAQFKALLADSPVTVCYQLTTPPVEYNLTPDRTRQFFGQNNIWSDSGDISLTYWQHN